MAGIEDDLRKSAIEIDWEEMSRSIDEEAEVEKVSCNRNVAVAAREKGKLKDKVALPSDDVGKTKKRGQRSNTKRKRKALPRDETKTNDHDVKFVTPGEELDSERGGQAAVSKLRPASDILHRLLWDPSYNPSDFHIGYLDRFPSSSISFPSTNNTNTDPHIHPGQEPNTLELPLTSWTTDTSSDQFIPLHRIRYFRHKDLDRVVWRRGPRPRAPPQGALGGNQGMRRRRDLVFGSGGSKGHEMGNGEVVEEEEEEEEFGDVFGVWESGSEGGAEGKRKE